MERNDTNSKLEMWGGVECTINRLGDTFNDQLVQSGHYNRPEDIERFISLNISAIRYPILWEHHQSTLHQEIDWTWTANQIDRLHEAGVTVIAGLVHHGSGPAFTELLDPKFPELLASYALKVAKRFPWLTHYTPVNEPMTTARFSGLYGLWFPHHSNDRSFLRMLIHQLKGTVLAMKAIRSVNPEAKFIQTEDLGKTHATDLLQYQADFENERRWLTMDLLHGKVVPTHPLWSYLLDSGIEQNELNFFSENICPPDCTGWNYYVTSERFLDEKTDDYPGIHVGGNITHSYVDVEAARIHRSSGLKELLKEAWNRFHSPMAITESHICCTREEQMRWLWDAWNISLQLKESGVNIRAVTAWAILGAFDWNSLLTKSEFVYESGAFDLRNNEVRPTALVTMIAALANKGSFFHPLLAQSGWWQHAGLHSGETVQPNFPRPLLIVSDRSTSDNFSAACNRRNIPHIILSFSEINFSARNSWEEIILKYKPWGVVFAQQYVSELSLVQCFQINVQAPGRIASVCRRHNMSFLAIFLKSHEDIRDHTFSAVSTHLKHANAYSKILGASWISVNFPNAIVTWSTTLEQNPPIDSVVSLHAALDILIDETPGPWNIGPTGDVTKTKWYNTSEVGHHGSRDSLKRIFKKLKIRAAQTRSAGNAGARRSSIIYQYFRHFISGILN